MTKDRSGCTPSLLSCYAPFSVNLLLYDHQRNTKLVPLDRWLLDRGGSSRGKTILNCVQYTKANVTQSVSSQCTYIHAYIHNTSYYVKTERLWRTKVHPYYTSNKLNKSNVKRCVFWARRKAACESVSLILTGRLFQMSGPQTEKACWPKWVLVRRTSANLWLLMHRSLFHTIHRMKWRHRVCGHDTIAILWV